MKKLTIVLLMLLMSLTVSADELDNDFDDNGVLVLQLTTPMNLDDAKNLLMDNYSIKLNNYIKVTSNFRGWFYRELSTGTEVNLYRVPDSAMICTILIRL